MLHELKSHIEQYIPGFSGKTFLLAVSGGIDSVVMCDLFHKLELKFGIAHCNFTLRGNESDGDEVFVKQLAKQYGTPFFSTSFNTTEFAAKEGISTQMAARELRYQWFEKIRQENDFDFICTAHHQNDVVETILINITRGAGIAGLHGILPVANNIFRPLLFTTREEIEAYAHTAQINYRTDSSNHSDYYIRNKIRHHVIPILKEINPSLEHTISESARLLGSIEQYYLDGITQKKEILLKKKDSGYAIDIVELQKEKHISVLLYEILKEFEFNASTINDILIALKSNESGKRFYSTNFVVVKDRNVLVIEEKGRLSFSEIGIAENTTTVTEPIKLTLHKAKKATDFIISKVNTIAQLDKDKLVFPLKVRSWQPGDFFYPLGMEGRKLLSDFFIDAKISVLEKQRIFVLVNGNNDIIWIIGHRLDNRYKITSQTKTVMYCQMA
ncbi:MAG: tRNA lysidine(34) synthetase TilS [Bacteroidetes bacterium]|nr:tRNA lysidine(34) synthetase TilS [Bacteroidota bacterium]